MAFIASKNFQKRRFHHFPAGLWAQQHDTCTLWWWRLHNKCLFFFFRILLGQSSLLLSTIKTRSVTKHWEGERNRKIREKQKIKTVSEQKSEIHWHLGQPKVRLKGPYVHTPTLLPFPGWTFPFCGEWEKLGNKTRERDQSLGNNLSPSCLFAYWWQMRTGYI